MGVKEKWAKTKEIKLTPKEIIKLVKDMALSYPAILVLYSFGSLARSNFKEGSDVDIAIYTTKDFSCDDFYQLYGELTRKLRSDRVDLVWLNKADPIISFEIIKT
ncbi:MAG: nucleotidyltransferase domain-containing protein, partial [Caldimicrobium sp.]